METFGTRVLAALDRRGPLCVGIDPHPSLLAQWGLDDDLRGLEQFSHTVTEALADRVAVLKPQSAFFERHGARGIAVLERVIREARTAGALVIGDMKRGDIGSTMAAYARAYLDPESPLNVDAVTVSPYLGFGSLSPIVDTAAAHGGGVFVLALTSNPEGPQVQHAVTADGVTVAQSILDAVADINANASPLGSVGVVIGATIGETQHDISGLNGPILVPGLGAQGGRPEDVRRLFGASRAGVIPSYSREVLGCGPGVTALREAADRALDQCRGVVG